MQLVKKEGGVVVGVPEENSNPKQSEEEDGSPQSSVANRHLAFEKNYPKNIFIPLI
jgi:hypothetical protein